MRIHSAFLIGFMAVAAPGCCASIWICAQSLRAWAEARDTERATRVVIDAQQAHTAFIVEMGQVASAILGSELDLQQLPASQKATDRALERALRSARGNAADEQGIAAAMAAAADVRRQTAPILAEAPPARSHEKVNWVITTRGEHGSRLTMIAYNAAMRISAASWLTAGLVHVGMQVMDLRELVGQRNLVMNSWVGGQAIRSEQIINVDQLTGRIDQAWANTTRIIDALPVVENVRAEERRQVDTYHDRDEKRWLAIVATARARLTSTLAQPSWPESLEGFRAWTQAAKENILRLCDVAMAEALEVAGDEAAAGRRRFAAAALLALLAFGTSLVAMAQLLGRIVGPIVAMTGVIDKIAKHEFDVRLPTRSRMAEIERMASAVDGLRQDVIAGEQSKQQIVELARHDVLTGLPNRRLFSAELEHALARAADGDARFALLLVDLDGFKPVNDLHGHAVGDLVLREVATRLRRVAGRACVVARLGGDEFALIVQIPDDAIPGDAAMALAEHVIQNLCEPVAANGVRLGVGASIGVALCPDDGVSDEDLLRAADLAMYEAKRCGRGTVRTYEPRMDESLRLRAALEQDMQQALADGGIEPFYQPLVDLVSRDVTGLEVLARWHHPTLGFVPPDRFIPIAEQLGLIDDVTTVLLRRACRDARHWGNDIRLALNVSPAQFQDQALPLRLLAVLTSEGFDPTRLELEVTESALVGDVEAAKATLEALQNLGIAVALDDFGTGYSSLCHLRDLRFDKVKIDRSFVQCMRTNFESRKIVDAIVSLAASLGMPAVAEGIEDEETLVELEGCGCRYGQGYVFSRAVPAPEVGSLIADLASRPVGAITIALA